MCVVRQPDHRVGARKWAIVTLYRDARASVTEIAQVLGLSASTVWHRLQKCDIPLRVEVAPTSLLKRQPYRELHHKGRKPDIVLGRRYCSGCGRWRHLCDFPPDNRKGRPYMPSSRCRACGDIGRRYYQHHTTAERIEARREYQRIYKEAKRREAGIPVSTARRARVTDRRERVFLDPGPLLAEIEWQYGDEYGPLSKLSGVPPRSIHRLRTGESAHVRLDVADKLAVGLGLPLELIYHGAEGIHLATLPRPR